MRGDGASWRVLGEGVAAGVLGTAGMTLVQTRLAGRIPAGEPAQPPSAPPEPEARSENPTETLARRVWVGVARRRLDPEQKRRAGIFVHYATGAAWGLVLASLARRPTALQGLAYGAAVWALNDNAIVPALRLAGWPKEYPLGVHARALAAHLAYGAGTALALSRIDRLLGHRRRGG